MERLAGLGQQPLVGIEHEHPVAVHVPQGLIAGRREIPWPGQLVHHRTAALGDGDGGIAGTGVQQHHLIDEARHRGQAALQPLGFVAHDHRETEHGPDGDGARNGQLGSSSVGEASARFSVSQPQSTAQSLQSFGLSQGHLAGAVDARDARRQ